MSRINPYSDEETERQLRRPSLFSPVLSKGISAALP